MRSVSVINARRSLGAMPAAGSSISSSFGLVGEREREFEPLDVAIGEFAAEPIGLIGHADERRAGAQRLVAMAAAPPSAASARARRRCESSAICTFSATVIEAKVAAIWNVRPTPRRQICARRHAVGAPTENADRARASARSGR